MKMHGKKISDKCPYCQEEDFEEVGDSGYSGREYWVSWRCNKCGCEWADTYLFHHYDINEVGHREDKEPLK